MFLFLLLQYKTISTAALFLRYKCVTSPL